VERILKCTPEQCVCQGSGKETVVIGYEESSQLDVEPAKYFVLISKREKRACESCEEQGVVSAPLPARIIEKCLVSDQIVIDTVISKYCDHQRLYRRSRMLERDSGVELIRATLDGWVLKVGEFAGPHGLGDEARVNPRHLYPSRRNPGGRADARWPREKPSSLSVAVQPTGRNSGV
jgi:transposase